MNNEEKILSMLEQLQIGQSRTDARLDAMQGDIQGLKGDMQVLKEDVQVLKEDVQVLKEDVQVLKTDMVEVKDRLTRIEVTQENVTNKHISLIFERNVDITRKLAALEDLPERVEDIQMTVSILKQAVKRG